jgi:hypothetical protein
MGAVSGSFMELRFTRSSGEDRICIRGDAAADEERQPMERYC